MGKASRDKGRRAQTEGRQLLLAEGWLCVDTSAGTDVEDVFAIDPHERRWSVEVTADQGISLTAKWGQAARQGEARGAAPLMLWKIDRAGWWLIARSGDVEDMRAFPLELELVPSGRMSFATMAARVAELRPSPTGAMPVLFPGGGLAAAPAEQALRRWWL